MATDAEFNIIYEQIKTAYQNTMIAVSNLKDNYKLQTKAMWEGCLKMIDDIFAMPIRIPANMEAVQQQWAETCLMIERLTDVKEDILKRLKPQTQETKRRGLTKKGIFGAAIFVASSAVFSYFIPGATGWFGRKVATTTMSVGRYVAPHGIQLLHKSIKYITPNSKNNVSTEVSGNDELGGDILTIAAGAMGALKAIKTGYELMNALKNSATKLGDFEFN